MSGPQVGDAVRVIKNDRFAGDLSQTRVGQRGTVLRLPGPGSRVYTVLFGDYEVACHLHELAPTRPDFDDMAAHRVEIAKLRLVAATVARLTQELALAQSELDEQRLVVAKALEVSP